MFEVAGAAGVEGDHIAALKTLSLAVDEIYDRHLTINATGAIAALLGEIGLPARIMQRDPAMVKMWQAAEHAVPYQDPTA